MQIFLIGTVFETAQCLDKKRLNKQIIEVRQIRNAINGESKGWRNHPVTKMYKEHYDFLLDYEISLIFYQRGNYEAAKRFSNRCEDEKPDFLKTADWYFENMKNRLYTKTKNIIQNFFLMQLKVFQTFIMLKGSGKSINRNKTYIIL